MSGSAAQTGRQMPKRQQRRIGRVGTRFGHDQHLARQRFEVGAKMHRALQRQDPFLGRIDAEMMQNGPVGGLQPPRRHGYLDARRRARAQQRHRPEIHAIAAIHRPGGGEPAGPEPQHREIADDRGDTRRPVVPAEREPVQDSPLARGVCRRGGGGIAQQRQQRALGMGRDQGGEQAGGIGGPTTTGIVLRVGQDDRPVAAAAPGVLDRIGGTPQPAGEAWLSSRERLRQPCRRRRWLTAKSSASVSSKPSKPPT